jgi:fumarylacetoacetate (FAA) hydrolase
MRFATLPDGSPDGRLYLVSRDNARCIPCAAAATLQQALESWQPLGAALEGEYARLNAGGGQPFDPARALAPLPRAWAWMDGSAFDNHGALMDEAFGVKADKIPGKPLMYQGMSDCFLPPTADVPLPSQEDGIDFEGEFGLLTSAVPMGTTNTTPHIALLVQINDWSLRTLGAAEMKTRFGWIQAKPACAMAPIALTPDELGPAWREGRIHLPLRVEWNGAHFGAPHGGEMSIGLDQLVAHAAYSRNLPAGTVIGSGTVSNANYRVVGSACIAERRAIEMLQAGAAQTPFMQFGDCVRMECRDDQDRPLFGAIDQTVIRATIYE